MKKTYLFFIALVLLSFSLSAQEAKTKIKIPDPEVTYGIAAEAEITLLSGNTVSSFETSDDTGVQKAEFDPWGPHASKFVSNDWVNFDWSKMSIKAEGKYDAFRATADDYSFLKVTSTWKDLFGFEVKHEYSRDTKEKSIVPANPVETLNRNITNTVSITYDRLETNGVKFWTKYDASQIYGIGNVADFGPKIGQLFTNFNEIGFQFDNDEIATKLVYKGNGSIPSTVTNPNTVDTATLEAKKMFGVWTALLNDSDEVKLRLANLDSDSKIDRPEFAMGKDNKIQFYSAVPADNIAHRKMNVLNTITPTEKLTIKAFAITPNVKNASGTTNVTFRDWLAGENLALSAEYILTDMGTLAAGTKLSIDYVKQGAAGTTSGPSLHLLNNALLPVVNRKNALWGSAVWVDARLDKMFGEGKAVFVGLDAQFGSNVNKAKTVEKIEAGKVIEIQMDSLTKINLYSEATMTINEKLSMSAGMLFSLGFGYDYKNLSATGVSFSDDKNALDVPANYVSSNYTEGAVLNSKVYGISPLEVKARADYILNNTVSLWASDNFKMNEGSLSETSHGGSRIPYGFYQRNTIGLGADFVANPKSKLSVGTDVNLYLGLPTESDLYIEGATDAEKAIVDAAYGVWKATNCNPFTMKVAFTYTY